MSVDPCPSCGAAMAADQRYCLSCGQRRAEARLDYLEVLRGGPAPAVAAGGPPLADARQRTNLTVIASIGCLLLAMGVGVLIGTAGGDDAVAPQAAPAAQVIKVQGGGAAAAAEPAAGSASAGKAKAKKKDSDVEEAATAADSKATNPELSQLESTSGDDYAKQSGKLPKQVSTGGKAPPKDDKAPAGGGDFEEIG